MMEGIVLLFAASATAFQSQTQITQGMPRSARTQLRAVEDLPGIADFPGFFDPFGISEGKSEARIKYFRETELRQVRGPDQILS